MRSNLLVLSALSVLIFSTAYSEESLTITTYYPSPYGSYREMRAQKMAIGETYIRESTACWGTSCPGGSVIVPDSASLIVEGNVGIGTSSPTTQRAPDSNGGLGLGLDTGNLDVNDVWLRNIQAWASSAINGNTRLVSGLPLLVSSYWIDGHPPKTHNDDNPPMNGWETIDRSSYLSYTNNEVPKALILKIASTETTVFMRPNGSTLNASNCNPPNCWTADDFKVMVNCAKNDNSSVTEVTMPLGSDGSLQWYIKRVDYPSSHTYAAYVYLVGWIE